MSPQSLADIQAVMPEILKQVPYIKLLVLFGSRARGGHLPSSDWDLALLFDEELRRKYEPNALRCFRSWVVLQEILSLGDDEMDWVDLKNASDLLAHAIARDGVVIYEREPGLFEAFRQQVLLTPEQLRTIRYQQKAEVEAALKQWEI